jgi:hypothetical protein
LSISVRSLPLYCTNPLPLILGVGDDDCVASMRWIYPLAFGCVSTSAVITKIFLATILEDFDDLVGQLSGFFPLTNAADQRIVSSLSPS